MPAGSTQSTLTLGTSGAATGSHALTVRATGSGVSDRTASLTLVVEAMPSYTLSAPTSLSVAQGASEDAAIAVTRTNFTGAVALSVSGAPAGVATTILPTSVTNGSATLTVDASGNPTPGDYALTLTGQADGLSDRTANISLTVTAEPQLSLQSPGGQTAVVAQPFSLMLTASGPGTLTFTSIGGPLPDGLALDGGTGELSGSPTIDALLAGTPAGTSSGVIIQVSDGTETVQTDPFSIDVVGAMLPVPYAYMPFDGSDLDDAFGLAGTPSGTVMSGQPGVIGESVRVSGTNSRISYPLGLASAVNDKEGFTFVSTINTMSAGTMFFGLSDATEFWGRVYAGLSNGAIELGGRSARRELEPFKSAFGSTAVNDGQFHTVVGVMDLPADRISIYVDGTLDGSGTVGFVRDTFEPFTPADGNMVGHSTGYADSTVAPDIRHDEVALWDSALDPVQAATLRWLILTGQTIQDYIGFTP